MRVAVAAVILMLVAVSIGALHWTLPISIGVAIVASLIALVLGVPPRETGHGPYCRPTSG